ncbi:MAG: exodeoxyribonuclease III [Smithellaceae bacterium]|nr:exodeoxyribonuclease III [Smithellaceae bacterium]
MDSLVIATYNVNSIRSRLHLVLPWLKTHRPDIFCLQETKVEDDGFPRQAFEELGYHVVFKGEKRYNGVAIVSREKPSEVAWGLDDGGPPDDSRLIRGVFAGVHVLNTYVPQGREPQSPQFAYKLEWLSRLKRFIAKNYTPGDPLVWCGDINIAPEPIDVHDPKRLLGHVCFNPEVWEALAEIKAWGLTDIFRLHHPNEPGQYTFFDYRVPKTLERGLGWRIDHLLATEAMANRSLNCAIDLAPRGAEKPSDHTVLFAEFKN